MMKMLHSVEVLSVNFRSSVLVDLDLSQNSSVSILSLIFFIVVKKTRLQMIKN